MLTLPRFKSNSRLQHASKNSPPLSKGDRGEAVALVQQGLVELLGGHYLPTSVSSGGAPRGDFNEETRRAVIDFQDIYGFPKTDMNNRVIRRRLAKDGVVGRQTLACFEENLQPLGAPIPSDPEWPADDPGSHPPESQQLIPNGITDKLDRRIMLDPNFENTLINWGVSTASTQLGEFLKKFPKAGFLASSVVQPLVWAIQGNTGDVADKTLYVLGLFPPLAASAAIVGIWKGIMDDDVMAKLEEVHDSEPARWKRAIFPAAEFSWNEMPDINAQLIAAAGGVAWQHPNGLWVYIKLENNGKPVQLCDYRPRAAKKILGPVLPLTPAGGGRFVWRSFKGGF